MADLSQTRANVKLGQSANARSRTAGETLLQGMPYYISSSDNLAYQCDANDGVAKAEAVGIAMTPASANGAFWGVEDRDVLIDPGATLVVGETYAVSATKGAICPLSDITSGQFPTRLGVATTTALLKVGIQPAGVAKA